jgi:hypothetical protein
MFRPTLTFFGAVQVSSLAVPVELAIRTTWPLWLIIVIGFATWVLSIMLYFAMEELLGIHRPWWRARKGGL